MIAAVLLIQAVAFAILSGIVASNKNRNPAGWGIIGFLFGLFGFIAAIAVGEGEEKQSTSRQRNQPSRTREFNPDEHEKKCPMCAEHIKLEARRCKHCGHEFSEEDVKEQIEQKKKEVEQSGGSPRKTRTSSASEPDAAGGTAAAIVIGVVILAVILVVLLSAA